MLLIIPEGETWYIFGQCGANSCNKNKSSDLLKWPITNMGEDEDYHVPKSKHKDYATTRKKEYIWGPPLASLSVRNWGQTATFSRSIDPWPNSPTLLLAILLSIALKFSCHFLGKRTQCPKLPTIQLPNTHCSPWFFTLLPWLFPEKSQTSTKTGTQSTFLIDSVEDLLIPLFS